MTIELTPEQEREAFNLSVVMLDAEDTHNLARELVALRAVAEAAVVFTRYHNNIIAQGPLCDCEPEGHICGWPTYRRETDYMNAALRAAGRDV